MGFCSTSQSVCVLIMCPSPLLLPSSSSSPLPLPSSPLLLPLVPSPRYASIPFLQVPFSVSWQCNLGAGLLMAPQVYWFTLICRGALRLFTGAGRSRRPTPKKADSDGHALPQSANGYSSCPSEPESTTH